MSARVVSAGDSALVVEFEDRIDPAVNRQVVSLARTLERAQIAGVRDIVPTFRSIAVYFDPLKTDSDALFDRLGREAAAAGDAPKIGDEMDRAATPSPIRIPVCYGGSFGPDLADVARFGGMTEPEAIALHSASTYRVFMLGFSPGFAYLGAVDARIAAPRRETPRLRVPAGSVGIAGQQTGVYPSATPGGWQLIGRTPIRPFDIERADPFLMKPGDAVQFYPIDQIEFEAMGAHGSAAVAR